jgi:hypothetical protein
VVIGFGHYFLQPELSKPHGVFVLQKITPLSFALFKSAPERSAPERSAPERSALKRFARERFAFVRSAPERSAFLRFAFVRFASVRFAFLRFAPLRFSPERFAPDKLHSSQLVVALSFKIFCAILASSFSTANTGCENTKIKDKR